MSCCKLQVIENTGNIGIDFCGVEANKAFFIPTYANDGTKNRILKSVLTSGDGTINKAVFDALINQSDVSKRLYPTPKIEEVEELMPESIKQSFTSGRSKKVKDGVRTMKFVIVGESPTYYNKIKSLECFKDLSFYSADSLGNARGKNSSDDLALEPFTIEDGSMDVTWAEPTGTTLSMITVMFELSQFDNVGDTLLLTADELAFNILKLNGLLNLNPTAATAIIATAFATTLNTDFGTALYKITAKGFVTADFTLYNNTTLAAVVVVAVENPDGTYTLTYLAQTAADALILTIAKEGYESTTLEIVAA